MPMLFSSNEHPYVFKMYRNGCRECLSMTPRLMIIGPCSKVQHGGDIDTTHAYHSSSQSPTLVRASSSVDHSIHAYPHDSRISFTSPTFILAILTAYLLSSIGQNSLIYSIAHPLDAPIKETIQELNSTMDSKPPLQAKSVRRKVHVVYYLSRGGGQMDHPHLLEGYLSAAQDGLRLRDFKRWLSILRGKSMPTSFAWSYKRTYKNGFIWHDLGENDLIQPLSKNEYVLMGSEIKEQGGSIAKCKCGGIQQQAETKVVTELGDIQEELLNKPVLRSPKVVTKSSSYNTEDHSVEGPIINSPACSAMIASENKFHDSGARITDKSSLYRGGASSRSFNDLTAQRLLEEVKRSNNYHDSKPLVTMKSFNGMSHGPNARVSVRDCEIIAEEDYIRDGFDANEHHKDGISDGPDEDDLNGTYIVDAATQTGDSTRCSTEDHQEGTNSTGYNNMVELVNSPGGSAKLSAVRRVSSARFNTHSLVAKGNLPMHFSQEFSKVPDVEKSIMMNQLSDGGETENVGLVSSSNHTSLHNHMGSPGASSSCSAMSMRSSTRFSRQDGNRMPLPATPRTTKKYGVKPDDHHHHHHHRHDHSKETSTTQYSSNPSTMTSSSAPHNLLKQLLTCGNADVVSDKKPNNTAENVMVISNNALSGLQTPSRPGANTMPPYQEGDKSKWVACKQGGLMKRMSSAASSDNRSVISATASEQGSLRDAMEMISSPESVCTASHRHLKRDMIRAHSLSTSSAAAALRSQNAHISAKDYAPTPPPSQRKIHHQHSSATVGNTSPGMLSVASSTSRRSSIRENEVNIIGGGDVEEGFHEALQSHHIGMRVSSKSRASKGNKNTLLINDILDRKESPQDMRDLDEDTINTKRGRPKTQPTSVSELHKLICNPGGTPTCGNHNKVTTTNFVASTEQNGHKNCQQTHIHRTREVYTPQHAKSRNALIATHGTSRTPTRSSNLNSPSIAYLSKSLNSPSSLFLEAQAITTPSSHHGSSWKELLWSPRNGSSQKEKEKRHMKP
ncbi:hypothetical protein GOP47_0009432 [Adiantum capillus-veneris]|uniref:SOSEKI DIX-like domain-containing protein n=1 Tax=Adiantum capillus-veneris TaxID=13818 RepID=A0A9D4ZJI3_ADICA|nr:hypothetical protein GOP47_0009432 [Adiantum capillus-veneris]